MNEYHSLSNLFVTVVLKLSSLVFIAFCQLQAPEISQRNINFDANIYHKIWDKSWLNIYGGTMGDFQNTFHESCPVFTY